MKNLATLRKKAGLTQMQFAKKIGVSTSSVAMWETGQRKPDYPTITQLCDFFSVTFEQLLGIPTNVRPLEEGVDVPVLGYVRAGMPTNETANVLGYEKISYQLSLTGEFFALKIQGNSMEPKISEGDIVIVRKQNTVESGRIAVVLVGQEEVTVKKVIMQKNGITLVPTNPDYTPLYYSPLECANLPVTIIGVVVELRARFL